MIEVRLKQIGIIIGTFTIGIISAISEIKIISVIDSLLPSSTKVLEFSRPGTITLFSTKGKIIQKLGPATREKITFEEMPLLVKRAFLSAEDRRFYNHKGVDVWGISRALITNLHARAVKEGGSTITQQLARIVFLSQDKTLTRKFKEAALALKLERELSKAEILQHYLNNVYLGSSAYGIADAAWVYFSKTPNELTLDEAALIAGLAPAPSLYSPLVNPQFAIKRRDIVLERMKQEGYISKVDYSQALNSSLNLKPATPKYLNSIAPFFSGWVYQQLPYLITPEQIEIGGLKIQTSINLEWQEAAKEIVNQLSEEDLEGAVVSIQPNTGLIKVLVGGKNFQANQFNRATQALRSPGSTFKLFTYAAAIQNGLSPTEKLIDKPRCWKDYCPKNFGDKYFGEITIEDSFIHSSNIVAVELLEIVGFEEVISMANKLGIGINRKIGKYYPLAIGAYEETVLNMTAAYAGLANRGVYIEPSPVEEIRGPNNALIWSHLNSRKERIALSKNTADIVNKMLQKAVSDGTGIAASMVSRQVTGKTGTSEGARDIWFIGSIPHLTTGIWFGYDDSRETSNSSGTAAWAWKQFISKIENDLDVNNFQ